MIWSFRTNGNYIDFVHTEETALQNEEVVFHLHNSSRCIDWSLPSDTTRISFTIDEVRYDNIRIQDIDFDGSPMNEQADFETNITAMFTGLAGGSPGGSSYLVYTANLTQTGTNAPIATILQNTINDDIIPEYNNIGDFTIASGSNSFGNNPIVFIAPIGVTQDAVYVEIKEVSSGGIRIKTIDLNTFNGANGLLNKTSIEIRVYP